MRVLLTGPFGKIGFRVTEALLAAGHAVVAFDVATPANRRTAQRLRQHVDVRWGDVTDADSVADAVTGVDAVIHNAAILPPASEANPARAERVNVGGTRHVLAAIAARAPAALLVYPSSISVHGSDPSTATALRRVGDPLRAEDAYAAHKIACEELIAAAGVRAVVLRIGACLEGRNATETDPRLLQMMFDIAPDWRVEYVHPKDVATAMVNALAIPAAVGRTLFLGGGPACQTTWHAFTSLTFDALGCGALPSEAFGAQPYYTAWMDTDDAQRLLRFQRHTLADFRAELGQQFRWVRPLLRPVRPLVRRYVLSHSPYLPR